MLTSELSNTPSLFFSTMDSKPSEHTIISPAILYFGTPVALISSLNEDLTTNICAMSSVFWLGHRCMLGFGSGSQTPQNIIARKQCVVNLPDETMTACVNALATTTGTEKPSQSKLDRGYRYVKDKWSVTGLTPQDSDFVQAKRVRECPVQMECEFIGSHFLMQDFPDLSGLLVAIELRVLRVHIHDNLRMEGYRNRVDPDKWKPMIMCFQELYGLRNGKIVESTLGRIDEEKYRRITRSSVVKTMGEEDKDLIVERGGLKN